MVAIAAHSGRGGHGFPNRVRFNINTKHGKHGKSDIAVMSLSCRPSHMNLQISMNRKSDQQFVDGELKVARKSLSTRRCRPTPNSEWIASGKSSAAVNKQPCTFS